MKQWLIKQFFEDIEEYESYKPYIKILTGGLIYYIGVMILIQVFL